MNENNRKFAMYWTEAMPSVETFVASMIHDYHGVQDILQETSIVLSEKMDEYDETRSFTSWAIGIARNKILSSKRMHARHPIIYNSDILELIGTACEEVSDELSNRRNALDHCMRKLKLNGRSRNVFLLRYRDNLKPGKVAARLGLSAVNVRVILNRLRCALRTCIEKQLQMGQV